MKAPRAPRLDGRRTAEFSAELRERARAWMPSWGIADGEHDVGAALLDIAARFSSEVAERLDRSGEKMRRGFLDWLAVRREAARPARMPVAFKLAGAAQTSVLAEAPVRLQADAEGTPVVFETEKDVRVVRGRLKVVVGVNTANDEFYLAPAGIGDLAPLEPLPVQWELQSFAAAGSRKLQLDPDTGLSAETIIEVAGHQYQVTKADKGIVTIEPGLDAELSPPATIRKVTSFAPYEADARNRQEHALYLGHMDLLNVDAEATIDVVGATTLVAGVTWQYWGKAEDSAEAGWQTLKLAPTQDQVGAVRLTKGKGAIEPREIGAGNSSRWIRAYATKAIGTEPRLQVDSLELKVNCTDELTCDQLAAAGKSPAAEGMANTTPLVLDNVFFPLGKEPRQFDAFYLGSQEAFSKKAAKVQVCFEMADPTFSSLSVLREGSLTNAVLAGVGADRALHLFAFAPATRVIDKFREREPLQPPGVPLDEQPPWRLPMWFQPRNPLFGIREEFFVGTSAGDAVWIWHEDTADASKSDWRSLDSISASTAASPPPMSGLVYLGGPNATLVALRDYAMYSRAWPAGANWTAVPGALAEEFESIVPVLVPSGSELVSSSAAGMVGISSAGQIVLVDSTWAFTTLLPLRTFRMDIRPVAVRLASGDTVIVAVENVPAQTLVAYRVTSATTREVTLDASVTILASLEAALVTTAGQTDLHIFAAAKDGGAGRLVTWTLHADPAKDVRLDAEISASGAQVGGAPTYAGGQILVPGNRADVLVSRFDPAGRHVETGTLEIGVVVPDTVVALQPNDLIVRRSGVEPFAKKITQAGSTKDHETLYPIESAFAAGLTGLDAYALTSPPLHGTLINSTTLALDATDQLTAAGEWLYIDSHFFKVGVLDHSFTPPRAPISPAPLGGPPYSALVLPHAVDYVRPIVTNGRVASFIRMSPPTNGNWDAALLARLPLAFPKLQPPSHRAKAFSLDVSNHPLLVALDSELAGGATVFALDEAVGEWVRRLGDTSVNPELSWEYWSGKGWSKLRVTLDETRHLKSKGAIKFDVPPDIASSDWAGKTNFWIRARLIGGDYGKEQVTVKSKTVNGVTEQTFERSSEGIRAPSVLKLTISYSVCVGVPPTFVLTQDSGSLRDQSDANSTAGATVEAFIPLAVTLERLSGAIKTAVQQDDCPPECGCGGAHSEAAATPATTTPVTETSAKSSAGSRALLLGLDATPSGSPVNVFLLVEKEHDHGAFSPLAIEALVADRFVPIVAQDATRGLGESGVVSMSFALEPTRRELFGQSLTWIRLTPADGADIGNWKPSLRGAYLNAVWASATETLTRELVGSSEGAPHLALKLARPPLLRDTLELRVREPLGEEERAALRRGDTKKVLSDVEGLPGDWVLWTQVTDPLDERADARVYALDEATGIIRFGDGLHGMIPPIGVDCIVAFSYKRTEPPKPGTDTVPGNLIAPRMPLNLVSPVESVEAVMSVDQSAGGAPPELDDRVLRFGFARVRHRNRAVTLRDIEDLALQSSPDFVQARAIQRRGFVRLVVVVRGRNPVPSAPQIRELRRELLKNAPVALSEPNALRIVGPSIRKLRIALTLRADQLDHAGALTDDVKRRINVLLDTATGGSLKDGWQLGASLQDEDIGLALIDAPHLASIVDITLHERAADGRAREWPATLAPHELAVLDDDPIRIELETAESKHAEVTA